VIRRSPAAAGSLRRCSARRDAPPGAARGRRAARDRDRLRSPRGGQGRVAGRAAPLPATAPPARRAGPVRTGRRPASGRSSSPVRVVEPQGRRPPIPIPSGTRPAPAALEAHEARGDSILICLRRPWLRRRSGQLILHHDERVGGDRPGCYWRPAHLGVHDARPIPGPRFDPRDVEPITVSPSVFRLTFPVRGAAGRPGRTPTRYADHAPSRLRISRSYSGK